VDPELVSSKPTDKENCMKDVYAIYKSKTEGRDRSRWVRVGVAFENKNGSLNVLLDALCPSAAASRFATVRVTERERRNRRRQDEQSNPLDAQNHR
jgi:hypothetical protein